MLDHTHAIDVIRAHATVEFDIGECLEARKYSAELAQRLAHFVAVSSDLEPAVAAADIAVAAAAVGSVSAYRQYSCDSPFDDFPIIRKKDLRDAPRRFVSSQSGTPWCKKSSATSGKAMDYLWDPLFFFEQLNLALRKIAYVRRLDCDRRRMFSISLTSGVPKVAQVVPDPLDRVGLMVRLTLDERDRKCMKSAVSLIRDASPQLLVSNPTFFAALLASWSNAERELVRPKLIVSSGSHLPSWLHDQLQDSFQCSVTSAYATSEFGLVGVECVDGKGYHLDGSHIYAETTASPNGSELVLSSVRNTAMPLVRYAMGDYGALADGPCSCKIATPRVMGLKGKEVPCYVFKGIPWDPARILESIWNLNEVVDFSLVQTSENSLRLELNCKRRLNETARKQLGEALKKALPCGVNFSIERVEGKLSARFAPYPLN